jgi:hypothetical protein
MFKAECAVTLRVETSTYDAFVPKQLIIAHRRGKKVMRLWKPERIYMKAFQKMGKFSITNFLVVWTCGGKEAGKSITQTLKSSTKDEEKGNDKIVAMKGYIEREFRRELLHDVWNSANFSPRLPGGKTKKFQFSSLQSHDYTIQQQIALTFFPPSAEKLQSCAHDVDQHVVNKRSRETSNKWLHTFWICCGVCDFLERFQIWRNRLNSGSEREKMPKQIIICGNWQKKYDWMEWRKAIKSF